MLYGEQSLSVCVCVCVCVGLCGWIQWLVELFTTSRCWDRETEREREKEREKERDSESFEGAHQRACGWGRVSEKTKKETWSETERKRERERERERERKREKERERERPVCVYNSHPSECKQLSSGGGGLGWANVQCRRKESKFCAV